MKRTMMLMVLAVFSFFGVIANDTTSAAAAPVASSRMVIKQDSRIDLLNQYLGNTNRKVYSKPHIKKEAGYRLQVVSTNDRTLAYKLKGELMEKFPSEKAYLMFQSPFFKVRFGNFKTKADALEFRDAFLNFMGRDNIYVVKDLIEYMWYPPKEDETIFATND
jgi:hypothetical protein